MTPLSTPLHTQVLLLFYCHYTRQPAVMKCSTVQKTLLKAWKKHGYFNVTGSTMPIFVIEILRMSSACSKKIQTETDKN